MTKNIEQKKNFITLKLSCFLFCFLFFKDIAAQKDSLKQELFAKRAILDTKIYREGKLMTPSKIKKLYAESGSNKLNKLYSRSNYFLYPGPVLVAGGIYVGYDAIKGVPKQILIDGTVYKYKERSIFQLLGGIGVFAAGVCLIEYANEFKATSVKLYNNGLNKAKKREISFGLTPNLGVGFKAKF